MRYTMAMRCNVPCPPDAVEVKIGQQVEKHSYSKYFQRADNYFRYKLLFGVPSCILLEKANTMDTPTINKKKGATSSVVDSAFHTECRSVKNTDSSLPG